MASNTSLDYLFVISPGRSGTAYLSKLLNLAATTDGRSITVLHEPTPVCCGRPMQEWNDGFPRRMQQLVAIKRKKMDSVRAGGLYIETNAQFIKAFGWEFLQSLSPYERKRVGVIWLERDRERVCDSFLANREAAGLEIFADVWNIRPGCARSLVSLPVPEAGLLHLRSVPLSPRNAVNWQSEEIRARAHCLKQTFPEIVFHHVDLEDLNVLEGVEKLLSQYGLCAASLDTMRDAVDVPTNTGKERAHACDDASNIAEQLGYCDDVFDNVIDPSCQFLYRSDIWQQRAQVVHRAADFVLKAVGAPFIRSHRRAILGMVDTASCMVGAKMAVVEQHDALCTSLFRGREIDYSDLRWNLICELVHRADPADDMFRFVTRVADGAYILDGLNPTLGRGESAEPCFAAKSSMISSRSSLVVCISGANGKSARHVVMKLVSLQCENGRPKSVPLALSLDVRLLVRDCEPSINKVRGVMADLRDTGLLPVASLHLSAHTDADSAFKDCDLALLLASAPRQPHFERYHLAALQKRIYRKHAIALQHYASPSCRVVVMANPVVSTAAFIAHVAPDLAPRITAVTELDAARARAELLRQFEGLHAATTSTSTSTGRDVVGVQVLGNHSASMWVDCSGAKFVDVCRDQGTPHAPEHGQYVRDVSGEPYLLSVLQAYTRARGRAVINLLGDTSVVAAVEALFRHLLFIMGNHCSLPTLPDEEIVMSMGVCLSQPQLESLISRCSDTRTTLLLPQQSMDMQRGKATVLDLSQRVHCISLPCTLDVRTMLPVVHEAALRRALSWTPLALQSLRTSLHELDTEMKAFVHEETAPTMPFSQAQSEPCLPSFRRHQQPTTPVSQSSNVVVIGGPHGLPLGSILKQRLDTAKQAMQSADVVLVYAGAGMSVSSGLADITDFTRAFPAVVERGLTSIFHVSSHEHFARDPVSAWGFWGARARSYGRAQPDDAVYGPLLQLCQSAPVGYHVTTSNIDRLFSKAGFREDALLEIHGSIFDVQCSNHPLCTTPVVRWDLASFHHLPVDEQEYVLEDQAQVPRCRSCGHPLRIATELADDGYFSKELVREQRKRHWDFLRSIPRSANVRHLCV